MYEQTQSESSCSEADSKGAIYDRQVGGRRLDKGEWFDKLDYIANLKQRPIRYDIDLTIIQSWRNDCQDTHGPCCNDRPSEKLAEYLSHLILVDVDNGSLAVRSCTTSYLALSYVWGTSVIPKSTTINFRNLSRPGAYYKDVDGVAIPKTIRDAILFTKRIGHRYLWVDCFSILQDVDSEDMQRMLRSMAYIFANAELTIVAAKGKSADYGLQGVHDTPQRRGLGDDALAYATLTHRYGYPIFSRWVKRGWTFQESLFSRRLLVFGDVVSWICGRCIQHEWFEDVVLDADGLWTTERPHLGVPTGMMSLIPDIPSLGRWGVLVKNYPRRRLTYDDDFTRAFAGATEVMSRTFPGGLLHGLPLFFFDIAMLWQPALVLKRHSGHPSWSWKGWKGEVNCLDAWFPYHAGLFRHSPRRREQDWLTPAPLIPLASYRLLSEQADLSKLNAFYDYQAFRTDDSRQLPPGWQRHENGWRQYFTKKNTYRGDFQFAYPLPDTKEFSHFFEPVHCTSTILLCTAPTVKVAFTTTTTEPHEKCRPVKTQVQNGHGAGTLLLCGREGSLPEVVVDATCELVAISEAEIVSAAGMFSWAQYCVEDLVGEDWSCEPGPCGGFYNVLWIQWEGDVAYRRGLGIVEKQEWLSLGAEIAAIKFG